MRCAPFAVRAIPKMTWAASRLDRIPLAEPPQRLTAGQFAESLPHRLSDTLLRLAPSPRPRPVRAGNLRQRFLGLVDRQPVEARADFPTKLSQERRVIELKVRSSCYLLSTFHDADVVNTPRLTKRLNCQNQERPRRNFVVQLRRFTNFWESGETLDFTDAYDR